MEKTLLKNAKKAEEIAQKLRRIQSEIEKVIVGQQTNMQRLLLGLLVRGHVLLEGVPGLAKTLMIKTLSDTMKTSFARIQFTPDLLPADITGTKIYHHKEGTFTTQKGPIFHQFILADEINRAPPKVQSALLEAMQEHQVSIQGETFPLPQPFFVLATQNPIETEGTYPLPEAEVDRFAMKLLFTYPSKEEEKQIIRRFTQGINPQAKALISPQEILSWQAFLPKIYADEKIEAYIAEIVDATRHPNTYALPFNDIIAYGASPRASLWLMLLSKAHALWEGRNYVLPDDVKTIAPDVLRHRIILTFEAEAEEISVEEVIEKILTTIPSP